MPFLSYELAMELKDAGFPQSSSGPTLFYIDDQTLIVAYPESATLSVGAVRVPTLNEMISACGSEISLIVRTGRGWSANGNIGETVGEAVARRWMSLHRRNPSCYSPPNFTDNSMLWSDELLNCEQREHSDRHRT